MMRGSLVILLVGLAGPVQAAPASVAIGDLVLDYDDTEWRIVPSPDGATMLPVGCTDFLCMDRMGVVVAIGPADGPLPDQVSRTERGFAEPLWGLMNDPPAWPGEGAVREINGFTVFATDRWSGCRAMSPSELTAILDHAGRRYVFASGIAAGCHGVWGIGREAFVEILAGLRPRI